MAGKVTPKRLPKPRTLLGWDGTDFFALKVDGDGHLQIDVLTAPLPDDAATQTTLALCLTSLQLIDNLPAALRTVGANALIAAGTDSIGAHHDIRTDTSGRLIVRGENQLFSYKAQVYGIATHTKVGNGNYTLLGLAVPLGEIWVLKSILAYNWTSAVAALEVGFDKAGAQYWGAGQGATPRITAIHTFTDTILVYQDKPAAFFHSCLNNDQLVLFWTGHSMTVET